MVISALIRPAADLKPPDGVRFLVVPGARTSSEMDRSGRPSGRIEQPVTGGLAHRLLSSCTRGRNGGMEYALTHWRKVIARARVILREPPLVSSWSAHDARRLADAGRRRAQHGALAQGFARGWGGDCRLTDSRCCNGMLAGADGAANRRCVRGSDATRHPAPTAQGETPVPRPWRSGARRGETGCVRGGRARSRASGLAWVPQTQSPLGRPGAHTLSVTQARWSPAALTRAFALAFWGLWVVAVCIHLRCVRRVPAGEALGGATPVVTMPPFHIGSPA